jgi:hypothetical protein
VAEEVDEVEGEVVDAGVVCSLRQYHYCRLVVMFEAA